MSKKDITTLLIACIVIGASIYFIITLLAPKKGAVNNTPQTQSDQSQQTIPAEVDETTYKSISTLSDYGKPDLSGIGKGDLFADF